MTSILFDLELIICKRDVKIICHSQVIILELEAQAVGSKEKIQDLA